MIRRNPELPGDGSRGLYPFERTNRLHRGSRQFCRMRVRIMSGPPLKALRMFSGTIPVPAGTSTFLDHIPYILLMRAEPEMMGIAAGRIITEMQHMEISRNIARGQQPGQPMRTDWPPCGAGIADIIDSISVRRVTPLPFPAAVLAQISMRTHLNILPETVGLCDGHQGIDGVFERLH